MTLNAFDIDFKVVEVTIVQASPSTAMVISCIEACWANDYPPSPSPRPQKDDQDQWIFQTEPVPLSWASIPHPKPDIEHYFVSSLENKKSHLQKLIVKQSGSLQPLSVESLHCGNYSLEQFKNDSLIRNSETGMWGSAETGQGFKLTMKAGDSGFYSAHPAPWPSKQWQHKRLTGCERKVAKSASKSSTTFLPALIIYIY